MSKPKIRVRQNYETDTSAQFTINLRDEVLQRLRTIAPARDRLSETLEYFVKMILLGALSDEFHP